MRDLPCGRLLEETVPVAFTMLSGEVLIGGDADLVQVDRDEYGVNQRWSFWHSRPKEPQVLPLDSELLGVVSSSNGKRILTWDNAGKVRIWDALTRKLAKVLDDPPWSILIGHGQQGFHGQPVRGALLNHDGTVAALVDDEGNLGLWDAGTGRRLGVGVLAGLHVREIAFLADDAALLVRHADGLSLVYLVGGVERHDLPGTTVWTEVIAAADGKVLATWNRQQGDFGAGESPTGPGFRRLRAYRLWGWKVPTASRRNSWSSLHRS